MAAPTLGLGLVLFAAVSACGGSGEATYAVPPSPDSVDDLTTRSAANPGEVGGQEESEEVRNAEETESVPPAATTAYAPEEGRVRVVVVGPAEGLSEVDQQAVDRFESELGEDHTVEVVSPSADEQAVASALSERDGDVSGVPRPGSWSQSPTVVFLKFGEPFAWPSNRGEASFGPLSLAVFHGVGMNPRYLDQVEFPTARRDHPGLFQDARGLVFDRAQRRFVKDLIAALEEEASP